MAERELGLGKLYKEIKDETISVASIFRDSSLTKTLAEKLGRVGQKKDKFLGVAHLRLANWGAGFLDYHFGFAWGGFRRYAVRQRLHAREHFREFRRKNPRVKKSPF